MKLPKFIMPVVMGVTMLLAGASYFIETARSDTHFEKLVIVSKGGVKHSFDIEIADTWPELEQGLMFREHMEPDHGMLFELPETKVIRFWMKNTLIPLDMLFIAPDGTIKKIHEKAETKSLTGISSGVPVNAVLELNGGRARALGIVAGDKVMHAYFRH
jgi:uncharacterized membrane protein (UPF0127 family)